MRLSSKFTVFAQYDQCPFEVASQFPLTQNATVFVKQALHKFSTRGTFYTGDICSRGVSLFIKLLMLDWSVRF